MLRVDDDLPAEERTVDVAVIGGALAGAATALLLRRELPSLRVLVVDRSAAFRRRVGEATVELSAYFLTRVLGLTSYLNEEHLVKQGFRFYFANEEARSLADCSEIGGRYLARIPAFQVDRARLDEEVLRRAEEAGVTTWRPATVASVALTPGGPQVLTVVRDGRRCRVIARWVVDASGLAALLARRNGWWRRNERHPTHAAWARWRGVGDWDGAELAARHPEWSRACLGMRGTATNHLMGDGWWAWLIPLKGGDVSVGVVWDPRRVDLPAGPTLGDRLRTLLTAHPAGGEILEGATFIDGDVHQRRHLAYGSTTFAGDGFALVGDAAGFLDPLYSPGLDWLAITVSSAVRTISAVQRGEAAAPVVADHQRRMSRCLARWFEAIYLDKYDYLGDHQLMRVGFTLDLGLYYLGVITQPYLRGPSTLAQGLFTSPPSVPVFWLMRTYNRRLAALGRSRRGRGTFGRTNAGRRDLIDGFTLEARSLVPILGALARWVLLEVTEGWRTWAGPSREAAVRRTPPESA